MAKRGPAERAAHPSVVVHDGPEVCARCKPLLAREEKFHAEAFHALAQSLDETLGRLNAERARREALERELAARCPTCGGTGAVERPGFGQETCHTCKGQGVTPDVTP